MKKRMLTVICRERWSIALRQFGLAFVSLVVCTGGSFAQNASSHPTWPGPGQLFVGTCYQPIDRSPEEIDRDIAIMKHAGFNVVRMGDLSWDSIEPSQGKFDFEWLDRVMDKAAKRH